MNRKEIFAHELRTCLANINALSVITIPNLVRYRRNFDKKNYFGKSSTTLPIQLR